MTNETRDAERQRALALLHRDVRDIARDEPRMTRAALAVVGEVTFAFLGACSTARGVAFFRQSRCAMLARSAENVASDSILFAQHAKRRTISSAE